MNRSTSFLIAGALGLAIIGCDRDEQAKTTVTNPDGSKTTVEVERDRDARTAGERAGDAVQRGVDRTGDAVQRGAERTGDAAQTAADRARGAADAMVPEDAGRVSEQLKEIVNAALTKDGFDDLVERLSKGDRDRLNDYANNTKFDDLNAKVASLQTAWKERFNQEFDLSKANLAQHVKLDNVKANPDGMSTAQATLPAMKGVEALKLDMIREGGAWKVNINDSITGEALKTSLLKHLDEVLTKRTDWPADANDAYRHVAHHILMALHDAGK